MRKALSSPRNFTMSVFLESAGQLCKSSITERILKTYTAGIFTKDFFDLPEKITCIYFVCFET